MRWLYAALFLVFGSFFTFQATARHVVVQVLEKKKLENFGTCTVGIIAVYCEKYVAEDGTVYLALYYEGEVMVVKRINKDGTQTNVYLAPKKKAVKKSK